MCTGPLPVPMASKAPHSDFCWATSALTWARYRSPTILYITVTSNLFHVCLTIRTLSLVERKIYDPSNGSYSSSSLSSFYSYSYCSPSNFSIHSPLRLVPQLNCPVPIQLVLPNRNIPRYSRFFTTAFLAARSFWGTFFLLLPASRYLWDATRRLHSNGAVTSSNYMISSWFLRAVQRMEFAASWTKYLLDPDYLCTESSRLRLLIYRPFFAAVFGCHSLKLDDENCVEEGNEVGENKET